MEKENYKGLNNSEIIAKSPFKSGFTLAEVLITLAIIGIIAAATIPTLLQKHFEQEMITKLKKNYSVINNAVAQAIRENGAPDEWDIGQAYNIDGAEKIYNYLKPYLKIQKECGGAARTGCFAINYKGLRSNNSTWDDLDFYGYYYKFMLEDGTAVLTTSRGTGCSNSSTIMSKKICGGIMMDLNGKKKPNRVGVDLFQFYLTEKNVLPAGISYMSKGLPQCKYDSNDDDNGQYCAVHVLYKGNMDYLHRKI